MLVGLPDGFRFHDLRHTGYTLAAPSGATLKDAMVRAGNPSEKPALVYQRSDLDYAETLAAGVTRPTTVRWETAHPWPHVPFPAAGQLFYEAPNLWRRGVTPAYDS